MALKDLFRSPFGLIAFASTIIVIGWSVAALLLDVPIWVIIIGLVIIISVSFWWLTRPRGTVRSSAPPTASAAEPIKPRDATRPDTKR